MMRKAPLLIVLALLAGAAGFALQRWLDRGPTLIGQAAPALVLHDTHGRAHALTALRGRWVLLNFWASWCAPCIDELPLLVDAQRRYGPLGLQVLGPALDTPDAIAPVVARLGINYPVMADFVQADAAMQALGNSRGALPYSVLIDPQGHIAEVVLGALSPQRLESLISQRLQAAATH